MVSCECGAEEVVLSLVDSAGNFYARGVCFCCESNAVLTLPVMSTQLWGRATAPVCAA